MYKNRIIETIVAFILNIVLTILNYISPSEAINSLMIVSLFIFILFVLYWLYEIVKYCLLSILFGNYKKLSLKQRIISLVICIIFFLVTIFVYLIEYTKYIYLNDKLKEKGAFSNISMLDKIDGKIKDYSMYDFSKDKYYTIFVVEMKNIKKKKKYII